MNYYLFTTDLRRAGVQRVVSILAERWSHDAAVTIVILRNEVEFDLPAAVRVITLNLATGPFQFFSGIMFWQAKRKLQAILAENKGPFALYSFLESPNLISVFLKRRFPNGIFIGGIHVNVFMYNRIFRLLYPCYGNLDALISCSQGHRLQFIEKFNIPPHKIHFIPNPIDFDDIKRQSAQIIPEFLAKLKNSYPLIIAAGRLEKVKNFSLLLHAFARMPASKNAAHLIILGDGSERHSLQRLAKKIGIAARLSMPGKMDNPYVWMTNCDLFVLSSNYEGWPMVLIEAMVSGLPVVACDCQTGPAEILHNGAFGKLVPTNNVEALSAAMITHLQCKKAEYPFLHEWRADVIARRYRKIAEDIFMRRKS